MSILSLVLTLLWIVDCVSPDVLISSKVKNLDLVPWVNKTFGFGSKLTDIEKLPLVNNVVPPSLVSWNPTKSGLKFLYSMLSLKNILFVSRNFYSVIICHLSF